VLSGAAGLVWGAGGLQGRELAGEVLILGETRAYPTIAI
jgi:hypothetical protein